MRTDKSSQNHHYHCFDGLAGLRLSQVMAFVVPCSSPGTTLIAKAKVSLA